ncbi:hypothetical protein DID77_03590 [Candidatus Marinamargulisbacteria bacterium SCGC AG-439-L15]|nr:hypothetical protein DID77_03590 [Candidatus Marinamargulisbacteria bacterium SCGC AG-439-L15]
MKQKYRYIGLVLILIQLWALSSCGEAVGMSSREDNATKTQSIALSQFEEDRLEAERVASENGWVIRQSDGWTTIQLRSIENGQPTYYITLGDASQERRSQLSSEIVLKVRESFNLTQSVDETGQLSVRTGLTELDALLDQNNIRLIKAYYTISNNEQSSIGLLKWIVLGLEDSHDQDSLLNDLNAIDSVSNAFIKDVHSR